jgi:hypothetical protein
MNRLIRVLVPLLAVAMACNADLPSPVFAEPQPVSVVVAKHYLVRVLGDSAAVDYWLERADGDRCAVSADAWAFVSVGEAWPCAWRSIG